MAMDPMVLGRGIVPFVVRNTERVSVSVWSRCSWEKGARRAR